MIPEHLLTAYRRTRVDVRGVGREWTVPAIDEDLPAAGWPPGIGDVWIVTAWNPWSRPIQVEQNRARQVALRATVRGAGIAALDAEGRALDDEWAEESLALVGVPFEAAHAIARRFGQQAVYRVRAGWLSVHDTGEPLTGAPRPGPASG